jgi:hypothetical protein
MYFFGANAAGSYSAGPKPCHHRRDSAKTIGSIPRTKVRLHFILPAVFLPQINAVLALLIIKARSVFRFGRHVLAQPLTRIQRAPIRMQLHLNANSRL